MIYTIKPESNSRINNTLFGERERKGEKQILQLGRTSVKLWEQKRKKVGIIYLFLVNEKAMQSPCWPLVNLLNKTAEKKTLESSRLNKETIGLSSKIVNNSKDYSRL